MRDLDYSESNNGDDENRNHGVPPEEVIKKYFFTNNNMSQLSTENLSSQDQQKYVEKDPLENSQGLEENYNKKLFNIT